jgi:hypothetical protein
MNKTLVRECRFYIMQRRKLPTLNMSKTKRSASDVVRVGAKYSQSSMAEAPARAEARGRSLPPSHVHLDMSFSTTLLSQTLDCRYLGSRTSSSHYHGVRVRAMSDSSRSDQR